MTEVGGLQVRRSKGDEHGDDIGSESGVILRNFVKAYPSSDLRLQ